MICKVSPETFLWHNLHSDFFALIVLFDLSLTHLLIVFSLFGASKLLQYTVRRERCLYSEFFGSVFSYIWIEYWDLQSKSPYSVRMRENMDQKNSECGQLLRSAEYHQNKRKYYTNWISYSTSFVIVSNAWCWSYLSFKYHGSGIRFLCYPWSRTQYLIIAWHMW